MTNLIPFPETAPPLAIERAPSRHSFKLLIHEGELDLIAGWTLARPDRETGGDLFGFWTHGGSPAVQFALGPGPQARHENAAFYQDRDHLIEAGLQAQTQHGLQHIGEWHSHHRMSLAEPSAGDVNTLRVLFERYPFERFLLCIANIVPAQRPERDDEVSSQQLRQSNVTVYARVKEYMDYFWSDPEGGQTFQVTLNAFLFHRERRIYERGLWVVLPGVSPVGSALRQTRPLRDMPQPSRAWVAPQTTLDHDVAADPEPAALRGWWAEPEGATFLQELYALCAEAYGACEIISDPVGGALAIKTSAEAADGRIGFELRFPPDVLSDAALLAPLDGRAPIRLDDAPPEPSLKWTASDFFKNIIEKLNIHNPAPDSGAAADDREGDADELERNAEDSPRPREGDS